MKIAYVILAHKNPHQLIRLVQRLMTDNSLFFIHVDKKASQSIVDEIEQALDRFSNIFFLTRVTCYWGSFGLVEAALQGIRMLIDKELGFDRLILLSAQDYPIKPLEQLDSFLQINFDKEFIECEDYNIPPEKSIPSSGIDRIRYWHFSIGKNRFVFPAKLESSVANRSRIKKYKTFKLFSVLWNHLLHYFPIKRKIPSNLNYFIGSQFWCLTEQSVKYIHEFVEHNPKIVDFFRYTDIPDESFFQTIVMNSPFSKQVVNQNLHYIDWQNPNPLFPRTFISSDISSLMSSSKFFARKFDTHKDAEILDLLDKDIILPL